LCFDCNKKYFAKKVQSFLKRTKIELFDICQRKWIFWILRATTIMSSGFKSILRDKGLVLIPKKAYYPNSPTKYEKDKARMKNF